MITMYYLLEPIEEPIEEAAKPDPDTKTTTYSIWHVFNLSWPRNAVLVSKHYLDRNEAVAKWQSLMDARKANNEPGIYKIRVRKLSPKQCRSYNVPVQE